MSGLGMKQDLCALKGNKPLKGWKNLKAEHTRLGNPRLSRPLIVRYAEGKQTLRKEYILWVAFLYY